MTFFEEEKQRELKMFAEMLAKLETRMKSDMQQLGPDKKSAFEKSVDQYIELKFNIVMLTEGFDSDLSERMRVPIAVLQMFIDQQRVAIVETYDKCLAMEISTEQMTAEMDEHVDYIINARLGQLRLGKIDA